MTVDERINGGVLANVGQAGASPSGVPPSAMAKRERSTDLLPSQLIWNSRGSCQSTQ
jgi:hypothetical protein